MEAKHWRKRDPPQREGSHLLKMPQGSPDLYGRKRTNDCIRNTSPKTFVTLDRVRDTVYPIQIIQEKVQNYKTVESEEPESV